MNTSEYNEYVDDILVYVDSRGVNQAGPNAGRTGLGLNFFNRTGPALFGPGRTILNSLAIRDGSSIL